MQEAKKNHYVGGAVIKQGQYGQIVSIDLDFTELYALLKNGGECNEHLREWTDRNGQTHKSIKLVVMEMKEENQKSFKTHSVKIDTWKPDPNYRKENTIAQDAATVDGDLPF